jgi:plastocyanin
MKTKAISSIFLLFTIAVGIISMSPASFADHSEVTITPISGSGSSSGCELTEEGCYNPSIATVDVGGVVTFSNTDSVSHTFSSGVPSDDVIGTEFNSGMLAPGDSAEWIPENIGEFSYFDMIHPWMQGTIIVQEAAAEEPVVVEEVVEEPVVVEEVVEEPVVVEEVVEEPVVVEEVVEEPVVATQESTEEGGGCLIATAAYGSELAPQVQMLREIRDNQLMNTESGSAFMTSFNELYYTFSPTIADMERESPVFKEIVKAGLTPMLSTLAIMENAESESEVLGLGLSVIALNLGMYIGLPAFGIIKVIQLRKN